MKYLIIKGDKVDGNSNSLARAKKICDKIESKEHKNCFIAKEVSRGKY